MKTIRTPPALFSCLLFVSLFSLRQPHKSTTQTAAAASDRLPTRLLSGCLFKPARPLAGGGGLLGGLLGAPRLV